MFVKFCVGCQKQHRLDEPQAKSVSKGSNHSWFPHYSNTKEHKGSHKRDGRRKAKDSRPFRESVFDGAANGTARKRPKRAECHHRADSQAYVPHIRSRLGNASRSKRN